MITRFYGNLLWFCAVILFMMLPSDTDSYCPCGNRQKELLLLYLVQWSYVLPGACKESAHGGKGEERERETLPKKQAPILFWCCVLSELKEEKEKEGKKKPGKIFLTYMAH